MATRFYFDSIVNAPIAVSFDSGWEVAATNKKYLRRKTTISTTTVLGSYSFNVPVTTTQDVALLQFVSDPIPSQLITGTVSLVITCSETATTDNLTLAAVIKVVSNDGSIVRGTLFSVFGTDTEFAVTASKATRIINNQSVSSLITQPGDRLVVELGCTATVPGASAAVLMNPGYAAASDFALTSGLTTSLNPWVEFSQNIFSSDYNNYQFLRVGNGMSTGEKIR